MGTSVQNMINPPVPVTTKNDFSAAEIDDPTKPVAAPDPNKTDFRTLITNSMDQVKKERAAKENGDLTAGSDAEFLQKLEDQTKEKRVPKNELGKDDFLKLFVTQLQNQDPLNPDDGTEMAAKLAQFNGLEQMMNVNKSLEKMLTDQSSGRNLQMVNYVGREVTIEGGRARLSNGVPTKTEFTLEMPAAAAGLEIRDSSGMIVAQKDLGTISAGTHAIPWDGKNNTGRTMPDGVYTYSLSARNVDGQNIPVTMTAKARITGVDIKSTDGTLFSDFGKIKFEQIKSVGRPGFDQDTPELPPLANKGPSSANVEEDLERMKAEGKLQLPGAGAKKPDPMQGELANLVNTAPMSAVNENMLGTLGNRGRQDRSGAESKEANAPKKSSAKKSVDQSETAPGKIAETQSAIAGTPNVVAGVGNSRSMPAAL